MSQLRENITPEKRRQVIIEYIKNHPGCKMEDIVKGVDNFVSRSIVFRIISELVKEKLVENKSTNRRDSALHLKKDNILLSVQQELDRFDDVYSDLIDKSIKRINNKNFSEISEKINLSTTNVYNWTDEDREKFRDYEQKNIRNFILNSNALIKSNKRIKEILEENKKLSERLESDKLSEDDRVLFGNLMYRLNEIRHEIIDYKNFFEDLDHDEWAKGFEFKILNIILTQIFFLFSDILFCRLTFIWSNNIKDKEILDKLRLLTSDKILHINSKLSKYMNNMKVMLPEEEYIKEMIDSRYEIQIWPFSMSVYFSKGLKLENDLKKVIEEIMILDKDLKKYRSTPLYSKYETYNEIKNYSYFIENPNLRDVDERFYFDDNSYFDSFEGPIYPSEDPSKVGDYDYYFIDNLDVSLIVKDLTKKEESLRNLKEIKELSNYI
ncbi:MAG: MarR family transcriptional regulator [Nitrososphaeraceae archaeon]